MYYLLAFNIISGSSSTGFRDWKGMANYLLFSWEGVAIYLFFLEGKGLPPIYFLFGFLFGRGLPNCLFILFGTAGHLSSFYLGGDGFCFPIWRGWPPI